VNRLSATSTARSLLDDGNDATAASGKNIILLSAGRIGGSGSISAADVIGGSGNFAAAIDFDLQGGTLTVIQNGPAGNIQLREVSGGLATSSLNLAGAILTPGNQLALISSGGDLTVDVSFTLSASSNVDLLLATTDGNSISITDGATVTNAGATAATVLVASGVPACFERRDHQRQY
jgi:hypothetical protein